MAKIIPGMGFLSAKVQERTVVLTTIAIRIETKVAISLETLLLSKKTTVSSIVSKSSLGVSRKGSIFRVSKEESMLGVSKEEGLPRISKEKSLPKVSN